jgi:AcrR family transcriptional regulator
MSAGPSPHEPSTPPLQSGAGRGARARQTILEAADDLLVERGYDGVTIEGIAARAGVAKQTIYRWWTSKVDLLMDSLLDDAAGDLPQIDTGSAATDLRLHLTRLADFLTDAPAGRVLAALIGQAQHDPRVADDLRQRYLAPRRALDRLMLARAADRGELAADADLDAILDALEGPVYYRSLMIGPAVDGRFVDDLVERILRPAVGGPGEPCRQPRGQI